MQVILWVEHIAYDCSTKSHMQLRQERNGDFHVEASSIKVIQYYFSFVLRITYYLHVGRQTGSQITH